MLTRENRGLYERKCVRYPSDLRDQEWALIASLIPPTQQPVTPRDAEAVVAARIDDHVGLRRHVTVDTSRPIAACG